MTPDQVPSRDALAAQARQLLELARERSGASVDEMVRALGQLQPKGAATRRSWYDWQEKPETVSLLTGLAAIQALGPQAAMRVLFGGVAGVLGEDEARLDRLQDAVADAVAETTKVRDGIDRLVVPELEKQGQLIAKILADMQEAGILRAETHEEADERQQRALGS